MVEDVIGIAESVRIAKKFAHRTAVAKCNVCERVRIIETDSEKNENANVDAFKESHRKCGEKKKRDTGV